MAGKSSVLIFVCYAFVAGGWAKPSAADAEALATPVVVNRTLPKVSPPKTGLEFSANPTTQEIFRARVFEEPLVPIGGEPSADENAAWPPRCSVTRNAAGRMISPASRVSGKHPKSPWRGGAAHRFGPRILQHGPLLARAGGVAKRRGRSRRTRRTRKAKPSPTVRWVNWRSCMRGWGG